MVVVVTLKGNDDVILNYNDDVTALTWVAVLDRRFAVKA
jgi:hypothetical protein